jgi:hypothetical protein
VECKNIQEKLSAYIEEIISSEEKGLIDKHLESCQRCKEYLINLRKTIEYVHNLEEVEPPSWLTQKIMAKVRAEVKPKKGIIQKLFYPLYIKLPIEAVATVAIAIAAMYIFKTIQPEIKLAKSPTKSDLVITREELPKQSQQLTPDSAIPKTGIALPPSRKDKKEALGKETLPEVPRPIDKQRIVKEMEMPAGMAEKHIEPGKEERIVQERYKALDMREKKETRAFAPESAGLLKVKKQTINIIVYVEDISIARDELEKTIKALGGDVLKTESFEDKDVLTAQLNPQKIEDFNKKIQLIGKVKKKESASEAMEDKVEIKIEIVKKAGK